MAVAPSVYTPRQGTRKGCPYTPPAPRPCTGTPCGTGTPPGHPARAPARGAPTPRPHPLRYGHPLRVPRCWRVPPGLIGAPARPPPARTFAPLVACTCCQRKRLFFIRFRVIRLPYRIKQGACIFFNARCVLPTQPPRDRHQAGRLHPGDRGHADRLPDVVAQRWSQ